MRTLTSLLTLCTLTTTAGCEFTDDAYKFDDTADTASDTASDTAGDTEPPAATARVRFLSLSSSASLTLHADATEGDTALAETLAPLHGSAFEEVPAGAFDLYVTNAEGELVREAGVTLADGGHYSVVYTPAGGLSVTENDDADVPTNSTRITYINLEADSSAAGFLTYRDEETSTWQGPGRIFTLESGASFVDDFEYVTTAARLEVEFEGLNNLLVAWNTAYYMQAAPGTFINVYFWTEGDCSGPGLGCDPMILGQDADGATSTVAYTDDPGYGWAG